MTREGSDMKMVRYQLVIVDTRANLLLVTTTKERSSFPEVFVCPRSRPAHAIQQACRTEWDTDVVVVSFLHSRGPVEQHLAVLELLASSESKDLRPVGLSTISTEDLTTDQRDAFTNLFSRVAGLPVTRLGWITKAIHWTETVTGLELAPRRGIEQFNAGNGFSLLRIWMKDGSEYWLKATGAPNLHEYAITNFLADPRRASAPYLPPVLAVREDWNAWLMCGEASPLPCIATDARGALPILGDAVVSLARLQIATIQDVPELLKRGAFDHRIEKLHAKAEEIFDYLQTAMEYQVSTRVPRIERTRLIGLCQIFVHSCRQLEALGIPSSLIHGDLNEDNIVRQSHCMFLDWSEACVSTPLVSLQHLLLLNRVENVEGHRDLDTRLKALYREEWSAVCDPTKLDAGFVFMPLIAAASALLGRGNWLASSEGRLSPARCSRARTLARHMDRAARAIEVHRAA